MEVPEWTAPNAVRHWGEDRRKVSNNGDVVGIAEVQLRGWVKRAGGGEGEVIINTSELGGRAKWWVWAMEAVKSRAFSERGGNGGDKRLRFAGVAVQAAGMLAVIKGGEGGEIFGGIGIAFGIAMAAGMGGGGEGEGVLLPYIDSANHKKGAGSRILYDGFRDVYSLVVEGRGEKEGGGGGQLFITYGDDRGEEDLAVNFGIGEGGDGEGE
ncbi:hypothetical protein TrCOL_g12867 [Triparma columacea]|uniref:Uncharacterized protein n=1 Tax=Triparma columacea TaxID=722753 RepID=A0A9W7FWH5_9STRA|nr:hypothetical protein TrCOL_g12867 [Triparma columacea]